MIPIDPAIESLELRVYAKDQPEYIPLPSRVDRNGTNVIVNRDGTTRAAGDEELRALVEKWRKLAESAECCQKEATRLGYTPERIEIHARTAKDLTKCADELEAALVMLVTCWRLTWRERLSVLWRGVFYLTLLTFNKPLQPIRCSIDKPEVEGE